MYKSEIQNGGFSIWIFNSTCCWRSHISHLLFPNGTNGPNYQSLAINGTNFPWDMTCTYVKFKVLCSRKIDEQYSNIRRRIREENKIIAITKKIDWQNRQLESDVKNIFKILLICIFLLSSINWKLQTALTLSKFIVQNSDVNLYR